MSSWSLRARWVFPVSSPPIPEGMVSLVDGRIVAVGPAGSSSTQVDLGNAAVLPGLVNAHTHLDLSGLRGLAPPSLDFTGWLRQVIAHRRRRTPEQTHADIRGGLSECLRFGTTLLGDISADGASWDLVTDAPLRVVVFRELLGLTQERASQARSTVNTWLQTHTPTANRRPGLSPHAPYSVRADLFGFCQAEGAREDVPVAVHLAESLAELELLRHKCGPFVDFLKELGVWDPDGLAVSAAEVMRAADGASTRQLLIHCNYLDRETLFRPEDTVVYCPRTHAAFSHSAHPFRHFLARGVRVAVGTDSLASNPDLDVLAEARLVHRLIPDLPGSVLLRMATLSGAEALGWADETGSLEAGKSADLVVLPLPERDEDDPHHLVFGSALPVRAVLWRGRWRMDTEGVLAPPPGQELP